MQIGAANPFSDSQQAKAAPRPKAEPFRPMEFKQAVEPKPVDAPVRPAPPGSQIDIRV